MDKVYLIYNDSPDDVCEMIGYIKGTENDAEKYCEEYNAKQKYRWNKVWYEELEKLN